MSSVVVSLPWLTTANDILCERLFDAPKATSTCASVCKAENEL